jgi:lipoprotein-anchoring transpeptidase ErfK/SrfK
MSRIFRTTFLSLGAAAALAAAAPGALARVAPSQTVAYLLATHKAYKSPGGAFQETVSRSRPITGEQTVLPVLAERMHGGKRWLLVRLPGRPNSHTGWIKAVGTSLGVIYWHIVVSTEQRRAWIYFKGHLKRSWLVVVGAPADPTPHGEFFIEENVQEPPSFPGSPYALATSARSNVFSEFDGGPGQVALHGMGGGLQATPGSAVSHGCVRFLNNEITWLAARIAPGTPLTIN